MDESEYMPKTGPAMLVYETAAIPGIQPHRDQVERILHLVYTMLMFGVTEQEIVDRLIKRGESK